MRALGAGTAPRASVRGVASAASLGAGRAHLAAQPIRAGLSCVVVVASPKGPAVFARLRTGGCFDAAVREGATLICEV